MSLPPIYPTGAMASGDYVDYMISYLSPAMDSESTQLIAYSADITLDDWYGKWTRITTDLNSQLSILEDEVSKLKAKINMSRDAINKL